MIYYLCNRDHCYRLEDMDIPVLSDIVVICALALGVIFVCRRLAIPTIVGFLLTVHL